MSRSFKALTLFVVIFAFYIIVAYYPWLFGLATFLISVFLFGPIERDRNLHDISFYVHGNLSKSQEKYIYYYGILETIGRGVFLGFLPVFIFSGTESERIFKLATIFAVCVFFGYFVLYVIKTRTQINPARWAYVKISVVLGLIFSLFSSLVPGQSLKEIATQTAKSRWWRELNFNEVAELLYGMLYQVNNFITTVLIKIFGNVLGQSLGFFISVNVLYGFVIALYSLLLLRFSNKYSATYLPTGLGDQPDK